VSVTAAYAGGVIVQKRSAEVPVVLGPAQRDAGPQETLPVDLALNRERGWKWNQPYSGWAARVSMTLGVDRSASGDGDAKV
jgi:hypothetical protein